MLNNMRASVLIFQSLVFIFCLLGSKVHAQIDYFPSKPAVSEGYMLSRFCRNLNQFRILRFEVDGEGNTYVLGHLQTVHNSQPNNFLAAELFYTAINPLAIYIEQNSDNPQTQITFLTKISPQAEVLWFKKVNFEMQEFFVHGNKIYTFVRNFNGVSFPPVPFNVAINNESFPVSQSTGEGLIVFDKTYGTPLKVFPHGNIGKYYFFSNKLTASIPTYFYSYDLVVFDENEEVINGPFAPPFGLSMITRNRKNNEHFMLQGQDFYRVFIDENNHLSRTLIMNISEAGTPGFGTINQIVEHDGYYYFFNSTSLGSFNELILKYDATGNLLLQIGVLDIYGGTTEGIDIDGQGNIWLITRSSYLKFYNYKDVTNTVYYTDNKEQVIEPSLVKFDGNTGKPLFSYRIGINTSGGSTYGNNNLSVKNHVWINPDKTKIYATIFSDKDFLLIPREDTYDYIASQIYCSNVSSPAGHYGLVWYDLSGIPILEVNEISTMNTFSVYPVPSSGSFTIEFAGDEERIFTLIDITGKELDVIHANVSPFVVNQALTSGIYFLKDNKTGQSLKLIVNHE
jgi:hypothetical protein